MGPEEVKKLINEVIKGELPKYLQSAAFTVRKITDTPIDRNQVVPMKYVNLFGSVTGRPQNSVVGQQFFNTTSGMPEFRRSDGAWVNGVGSVV